MIGFWKKCTKVTVLLVIVMGVSTPVPFHAAMYHRDGDARPEYVAGEILVKYNGSAPLSTVERIVREKGCELVAHIERLRVARIRIPGETDIFSMIDSFSSHPAVEQAEPNYLHYPHVVPDDPRLPDQWAIEKMEFFDAWDIEQGSTSEVIIAIIDSGVDYFHVDLEDNIWINPGEDLDHDGEVWDEDDMNNIDDDGNGFKDDLLGWNFVGYGDNDPMDTDTETSHGTHCSGIAAAIGDNATGIAGSNWHCRIMCLKGIEGGSGSNYDLAECIDYAAENGADIISMSWGNYHNSSVLYSAIEDAYIAGLLLFSSAGNDNTDNEGYPAAYHEVVAVASTDQNDIKSDFSNWGIWIQVCAPGSSILSTILDDNYGKLNGTSMSCPYAAGATALLKSQNPDSSQSWILDELFNTCDDIDSLNPGYEGKLGYGRVNAFTLVGSHLYPNLTVREILLDDSQGNGDGRPDPGETVTLDITLENDHLPWKDATDVTVTLRTTSTGIDITDDTKSYGDISREQSVTRTFTFEVIETAEAHLAEFTLHIEGQPNDYSREVTFELMISRPQVLLVDDDEGETIETWYQDLLDEMLWRVYDVWEVNDDGDLPADEMKLYDMLVWFSGRKEGTVADDTTALKEYLDGGGTLLLVNQFLETTLGGTDFYAHYLHANPIEEHSGEFVLGGVDGDPLGDGLGGIVNTGPGGANNTVSPGAIEPVNGARASFIYELVSQNPCVILYNGADHKVAYWATSFEAITSRDMRGLILGRIFKVFGIDYEGSITGVALHAKGTDKGVLLSWTDSGSEKRKGYVLNRKEGNGEYLRVGPPLFTPAQVNRFLDDSVRLRTHYRYRLDMLDMRGGVSGSSEISITFTGPPGQAAAASRLMPPFPNPFNPETVIRYRVGTDQYSDPSETHRVKVTVHNIQGQRVASLVDEEQQCGTYSIRWTATCGTGTSLPSGIYFCTLNIDGRRQTKKLLLLK
jgi:subtilisin family serine protease